MSPLLVVGLALFGVEEPPPSPSPMPTLAVETTAPPPAPASPPLQVVRAPIFSPHHPQTRGLHGISTGVGLMCPNYSLPSAGFEAWCTPRVRLAVDFLFGDLHAGLLLGSAISVGGQLGLELGSPYFRLGKHSGAALAIRTSIDGMVAAVRADLPGRSDAGLLALTNTYGPNFSFAVRRRSAFELRLAGGWSLAGFYGDARGFARPIIAAVADVWLGVRFLP